MPCRFCSRRFWLPLAITVIVIAMAAPHLWAWRQLRSAREALGRHHPHEARQSLSACAGVWGGHAAVRLAACRAAWQSGDLPAAVSELREAQRLIGRATEETAFEWALIQAAGGQVREVEQYLQGRAEQSPGAGRLVWEALALGYLRIYRTLDAMACLNHWLNLEPENVRALELRGETYVVGKGVARGAEDFRRALELDPSRTETRRRLADAALALGAYEEAARHLEILARDSPDDADLAAKLGRAYLFTQRPDEARRLLDAALLKHPDDGLCLRNRGHLAIIEQRFAEAEVDLRRAASLLPWDYQVQNLLFQALQQQGKTAEAEAQLKISERTRDQAERLGELQSRKLAEFPLDPDLHCEMGTLLIQTGRGDVGVQWLRSALQLDPSHKAAREALARYQKSPQ